MSEAHSRPSPTLDVPRLDTSTSFRKEADVALKRASRAMGIDNHPQEIRLVGRRRFYGAWVSRTPVLRAEFLSYGINLRAESPSVVEGKVIGRRTEPCP
jgi:hypothetical protein